MSSGFVHPEAFPEGNYHETCGPDAPEDTQCDDPYQCLIYDSTARPQPAAVCTVLCETATDCPAVTTTHCGDQTACDDGVCGFWLCL